MAVMTEVAEMNGRDSQVRPEDWLLLWCMEHTDADEDSIRRASGRSAAELDELRSSNPETLTEIRGLHRMGALLSISMLFELLRQRLAAMLAVATKPAELRSLLGSLRQLPGARELLRPAPSATGQVGPMAAELAQVEQLIGADSSLSRQQLRALERRMRKALGK
ncbi:MAG: hypothetical protein H7A35_14010 [Planctomycetales bacterium]|nr:MAG: hypothetical protein H7A35_14010 [Planctomycetales bacterium]